MGKKEKKEKVNNDIYAEEEQGFLKRFFSIFLPGIRLKLAVFIGIIVTATIFIFSYINLQQQSKILSDSYDREAAISRKYISSFVLELDNIAQNLIRIEEFRDRLQKNRQELRKYQTVRSYTYKKKVSVLGVKTNLFGAAGGGRVVRRLDTYYSSYLSDKDMKELENRTKALLQPPGEPPISDRDFAILSALAGNFVKSNDVVLDLRQKLQEDENSPQAEKLKKLIEKASLKAQQDHLKLDHKITDLLKSSRKKKIVELGLDTSRFRIQTFSIGAVLSGETKTPTLDTNIFAPESPLNQKIDVWILEADLERALQTMIESPDIQNDVSPVEPEIKGLNVQVMYSPHLRNPSSSIRLQKVSRYSSLGTREFNEFLTKDASIAQRISDISTMIAEKLKDLKKAKRPQAPAKDKDFNELYAKYRTLLKERADAVEEFKKANNEIYNPGLMDAMETLRDAALEDMILIHFENSPATYDEYMSSEDVRKIRKRRWDAIRNWIYAGQIETPPPALQNLFREGMIGFSRSEAEEIMWKLDGLPLSSRDGTDAVNHIFENNFAGVIRTLVDRSAGINAIQVNKDKIRFYALLITVTVIILSFILTGIIVKKIKKIIVGAEQVGRGNLNINFPKAGWDEVGKLSLALNHMVTGLNEREKIKGILGSMVDPVVIGEAMKDLQALKNGTEKNITAFFSDVAGFSTISEKLTSIDLASLLNEYLSAMTLILKEHEGVLDKYIGDAIVGIWNAPVDVENHTLKAVKASIRMLEKMTELKAQWHHDQKYIPEAWEMQFRIGLNFGPAKVGFMGTDALAAYTMMGDSVNLAARLEAAAKDYGVNILASESVYQEIKDQIVTRKLDFIKVKGKNEPVTIYEIISDTEKEVVPRGRKDAARLYEEALDLYLKKDWGKAIHTFQESEKILGKEDKAVRMLIERIEQYRKTPPPENWDGSFERKHK